MFSITTTNSIEASDIKLGLKHACRWRCGLNNLNIIGLLVSPKLHYVAILFRGGDKEWKILLGLVFWRGQELSLLVDISVRARPSWGCRGAWLTSLWRWMLDLKNWFSCIFLFVCARMWCMIESLTAQNQRIRASTSWLQDCSFISCHPSCTKKKACPVDFQCKLRSWSGYACSKWY